MSTGESAEGSDKEPASEEPANVSVDTEPSVDEVPVSPVVIVIVIVAVAAVVAFIINKRKNNN